MTRDEIHQLWLDATKGGVGDSAVHELADTVDKLRIRLRSRYALSAATLALLDQFKAEAVHETKARIVNGGCAPRGIQ